MNSIITRLMAAATIAFFFFSLGPVGAEGQEVVEVQLIPLKSTSQAGKVSLTAKVRLTNKLTSSIRNVKAVAVRSDRCEVTPGVVAVAEIPARSGVVADVTLNVAYPEPKQSDTDSGGALSWNLSYEVDASAAPTAGVGGISTASAPATPQATKSVTLLDKLPSGLTLAETLRTFTPAQLLELWDASGREQRKILQDLILDKLPQSLPALRTSAQMGSPGLKMLAMATLSEVNDKGAEEAVLATLRDTDETVRVRAVTTIGKIKAQKAGSAIKEMLISPETKVPLRKACLAALGQLGNIDDAPSIAAFLADADEHVRINAAAALAMLGNSSGESFLLDATRSPDPLTRKEATYALGFLQSSAATARLNEILNDPKGTWKSYAQIALAQQLVSKGQPSERLRVLGGLARGPDPQVADWALERLAEREDQGTAQILNEVAKAGGRQSKKATHLLRVKEAR